jgi:nicotinamidase-related amidase
MPVTTLDERTALVTIDLQNGIVALPAAHPVEQVVANAARLATAFRRAGLPVINVRVRFSHDFADAPHPRADDPLPGGAPAAGWDEYVDGLGVDPSDLQVTKRQWGAFYGTDLELQLHRRGITGIVLAGIATSIGVESTGRAAFDHGYHVTLAADATTDPDPEGYRHSVERVFPRFAEVDTTDAIVAALT